MRSQFLSTVFLALCLARGVLAAPLEVTHDPIRMTGGVPDQEETDNLARIKTSEADANRHILKMEHVLNNPTDTKNKEMIEASFGKNANMKTIKDTVQTLKTGKLPVKLPTDSKPGLLAEVHYDNNNPANAGAAYFGQDFHDGKGTANMRAATLVHEATHKLSNTGDTVDKNNHMIPGNDFLTPESGRSGYASHIEPATTVAQLNADPKWSKKRDGAPGFPAIADMHNNAESYAQFGSLCDAAISNAAVGLRRRAMLEGDWHTAAIHLVRRQACAMRKKGAAKPAATAAKNAKLTPAAKGKPAAVSKLTAKKPVGTAATAAGKKSTPKSTLRKGGLAKAPLSKTTTKSKIPLRSKSSIASSKLGKSRLTTPKTAVTKKTPLTGSKKTALTGSKKTTLTGSKTAARKASSKKVAGVKATARKPVAGKTNARKAVTAKTAVRKPVAAKASVRKPVAAKASVRKPAAVREPTSAKANVRKPAVSKNAVRKPAPTRKPTATKAAIRKPASSKANVRKPTAAKAAIRKPASTKASVRKPAVARTAVRKPVAAKAPVRKPASASANVRKPAVAKTAVRKPAVAKAAVRKPAAAKTSVRKPVTAKAAVRKPVATKMSVRKPTVATSAVRKSVAAKNTIRKPVTAKAKPIAAKAAVRKPVPNKPAAVRKPVAPVAKPAAAKPVAKVAPKAAAAKTATKKVRRELDF